ncbi:hypothetical protein [Polaromonas sp. P5_D5]
MAQIGMARTYSIYDLVREVSVRPGMYLGQETIDKLGCYIWGYKKAMHDLGVPESPIFDPYEFTSWVRRKYNYPGSAEIAGWEKTVLAISLEIPGDEVEWDKLPTNVSVERHRSSVYFFFELLKEFGERKNAI